MIAYRIIKIKEEEEGRHRYLCDNGVFSLFEWNAVYFQSLKSAQKRVKIYYSNIKSRVLIEEVYMEILNVHEGNGK